MTGGCHLVLLIHGGAPPPACRVGTRADANAGRTATSQRSQECERGTQECVRHKETKLGGRAGGDRERYVAKTGSQQFGVILRAEPDQILYFRVRDRQT